jgi:hypothetical protein
MEPFQKQRHVAPEFVIRGSRTGAQDMIAVSVRKKQNLLDKESRSLANFIDGPAG